MLHICTHMYYMTLAPKMVLNVHDQNSNIDSYVIKRIERGYADKTDTIQQIVILKLKKGAGNLTDVVPKFSTKRKLK